jgi:arylsulfatase A-like enzyme
MKKLLGLFVLVCGAAAPAGERPNVVMFVVDDMCDWIGPMGHKQAITPNMDRLAARGVTFQNAHTAGIFCAPSRSAIFTGRHASTTGCYTTQVYFQSRPKITPLQQVLQRAGYATYGAGKLFHHPAGFVDLRGWTEFFVRDRGQKTRGWALESWSVDDPILPKPYPNSIFNHDREPANKFFLEWGRVLDENEGKMADTIRTEWACDLVRRKHDKPFFVAVGLYTPHFPNYAPKKYFDLYDPARIELPPTKADDLDDLPPAVRRAKIARSAIHKRLEKLGAVKDAIHGYLACISYADAMLGRVLDAIEAGPNADNTIIVLWSDHGYHHGEKLDWGKHTLWERTSNVPFLWAGPGITRGASVDATVSLIDVFPTLTELCDVTDGAARDGVSLASVLRNPASAKDRSVLLPGMRPREYAIINRDWRYIRYADGGEELYDVRKDPNEWKNLAGRAEHKSVKDRLRAAAPKTFAEPGATSRDLRLLIEGETFEWRARRRPTAKALPKSVAGVKMVLRESNHEAQMAPVKQAGRSAWKSTLRRGKPTYFYFKLEDEAWRYGGQPAVQVAVTCLDRGNAEVVVEYDSSDKRVNAQHPKGPGAFKEAVRFRVKGSGKWKAVVFDLKDARFAGRCNGGDLRLGFIGADADPVVAEVLVKPLR